eukprot:2213239-Pyramimonas_sp.AAC.1
MEQIRDLRCSPWDRHDRRPSWVCTNWHGTRHGSAVKDTVRLSITGPAANCPSAGGDPRWPHI